MAGCKCYNQDNKKDSGDDHYGTKICNQELVSWFWKNYNFDYEHWRDNFDCDACNTDKPLARAFNALWALNYSSDNPQDESYDNKNMLYWGGRYVREQMSGYQLWKVCGTDDENDANFHVNAATFGSKCTEYGETVKSDCKEYRDDGYKSCSEWSAWFSWLCFTWIWVTNLFCVSWGYISSWTCKGGLAIANLVSTQYRIELYNSNFFYRQNVAERAAILIHECRHINGKAHDANFPSWANGIAGKSGADSNWEYQGAFCWQVIWLAWYGYYAQNSTPALKTKAIDSANSILRYAFAEMPSFTF